MITETESPECAQGLHAQCPDSRFDNEDCACDCHGLQRGLESIIGDTAPRMSMQDAMLEVFNENPELQPTILAGDFRNGARARQVVEAVIAKRGQWGDLPKATFCDKPRGQQVWEDGIVRIDVKPCGWALNPGDECPYDHYARPV